MRREDQERAAEIYAKARASAQARGNITRGDLIAMGAAIWKRSYALSESDDGALGALLDTSGDMQLAGGLSLADALMLPNQQLLTMGPALWFHAGLPQVQIGDKFAAALLATKPSIELADNVRAPWRAFYIVLPRELFWTEGDHGLVPLIGVLVLRYEAGTRAMHTDKATWAWAGITGTSLTLWQHGYTSEMLASEKDFGSSYDQFTVSEAMEAVDVRSSRLIGRLILNVCLALNEPSNIQKAPPGAWSGVPARVRDGKLPACRTWVLGRERIVDCRDAVKTFLRTGQRHQGLTVQFPVMGHWRQQAHGPGMSLRRTQWIEPYWKGAENAPILTPNLKTE